MRLAQPRSRSVSRSAPTMPTIDPSTASTASRFGAHLIVGVLVKPLSRCDAGSWLGGPTLVHGSSSFLQRQKWRKSCPCPSGPGGPSISLNWKSKKSIFANLGAFSGCGQSSDNKGRSKNVDRLDHRTNHSALAIFRWTRPWTRGPCQDLSRAPTQATHQSAFRSWRGTRQGAG